MSPEVNVLPLFNDTSPCIYKLFNDTSVSLSIVVPVIFIVFVAPVPDAVTPTPVKFNVVADVSNETPSFNIVNEPPPPPPLVNKLLP